MTEEIRITKRAAAEGMMAIKLFPCGCGMD